jgi:hypothetical protein
MANPNQGDVLTYNGSAWVNQNQVLGPLGIGGTLAWSGHVTASGGSNPKVAPGANLGTGGSATVTLYSDSNDTRGRIDFTPGTIPAPGQMVKVTFASTYPANACYVFVQALDNQGALLGYSVGDRLPAGFNLYTQNAPTAGQLYSVYYWVIN